VVSTLTHIDFDGGKFVKMSDVIFNLATTDPSDKRMSIPWRIWEIPLGRMNNFGHAGFRRDELAALVTGKTVPGQGWGSEDAVSRVERQLVWKYVKVLKDLGRVAPSSTTLCIVVRHDIVTRPRGKGGYDDMCCEPDHMDVRRMAWEPPHGWFDPETGVVSSVNGAPSWTPNVSQNNTRTPWNTQGVA
jgi:hypothetical protein